MRTSSRTARALQPLPRRTGIGLAALVAGLLVVAACGPSTTVTAAPPGGGSGASATAGPPDLHISGSVDVNRIFQILAAAHLSVHQETLQGAGPNGEPSATLFIVDGSIKVAIDSFSSPAAVANAGFTSGSKPVRGDAPYTFWAHNIVIHVGNQQPGALPAGPDQATTIAAEEIARVIDPYIGPLTQRSVTPIVLPSTPEPAVATPTPTPAPTATPKPTVKPKPKPTPRPTKKP